MCDICVTEAVKERMLSRRSFFRGAAATAAGVAAGSVFQAPAALAQGHSAVEDLTHELHEGFPTFFGEQQFFFDQKFTYARDKFNLAEFRVNEHTGTHIDAPLHFSADGMSVAEIPVGNLVVPLCIVDIAAKAEDNPDAQLTPDDLKAWIATHGEIPANACVAMHSGWGRHVATERFRNTGADDMGHYPGFHVEAAQMLLETQAGSIGVDTLSLDHGVSPDFATHYAWLPSGRFGIECLANLDKLPPVGATLVVGAPKHRGGTGGPARVIALI
ncbi:cyclase family protein [Cereibacter sphaeroides]|uniref:cyclase family protein n=1 Tax=Cereibacter sphaeroides TaxID=1063 RepID=UPI000F529E2B|nr:cyclase family protein [Cereibacter sphaeroides]AZB65771.1 cyclase family protein [Cereibacter sphaeroides]AZB70527.1 cyclase family protein [Cereibacter sphaeroides]